ncbi:MAG: DedA family protein [Gammaproteobacteria bacterium]|nr:DedA family protein [Gammaproteobacteria bacterium]
MELITAAVDVLLHLDRHLEALIAAYGMWVYVILFLIIFCETGLVVTPFLPGDSLLFVVGTLAGAGLLDVGWIIPSLIIAAILGDSVNYWIGGLAGPAVFRRDDSLLFKRRHLERTHQFYERHGGKTIIIARFVPIVRTFAPFVAGIGRMAYARFLAYNVTGAVAWVTLFVGAGYWFGDLPVVRQNLTLIIFGIIIVSVLPGVFEYLRHRRRPGT